MQLIADTGLLHVCRCLPPGRDYFRPMIRRWLAITALGLCAGCLHPTAPARPRLAVVIAIDQMRADYLERFAPYFGEGGFRRFTAQGLVFTECHYRDSVTKTGPGHATILSGVYANLHGIVGNEWKLREWPAVEQVNCVEDRGAPLVGVIPRAWRATNGPVDAKAGRSPRNFLAATVGDQLKLRYGTRAKVFGVADKDRSAILMAGKLADGSYWNQEGVFVTSTFYRAALPGWIAAFNAEGRAEKFFGRDWTRLLDASVYDAVQGPDDAAGEAREAGLPTTFPKRIDGGHPALSADFFEALEHTPWEDKLAVDFAEKLVVHEQLGQDDGAPDLLALGLSQVDKAGHAYGPDSHEIMDSLLRLDRTLAGLFEFLDRKIGTAHYTVVLTADHGIVPLPERIQAAGGGFAAGRVKYADVDREIFAALEAKFGALPAGERWAVRDGMGYHLNPAVLAARQLAPVVVEDAMRDALLAYPAIAAAYTRTRFADPAPLDAIGEAMRLSYYPPRSGDVVFVFKPYFIGRLDTGTDHGTPYDYDTHVPQAWFGAGVPAGKRTERVGVDDIAPTLASLLGVSGPPQAAGRPLF